MRRCLNKAQKAIGDFNNVHRFGGEGATEEQKARATPERCISITYCVSAIVAGHRASSGSARNAHALRPQVICQNKTLEIKLCWGVVCVLTTAPLSP